MPRGIRRDDSDKTCREDDPALLSGAAAYLSARVNVNLSAALTSGKVRVVACGTEE